MDKRIMIDDVVCICLF